MILHFLSCALFLHLGCGHALLILCNIKENTQHRSRHLSLHLNHKGFSNEFLPSIAAAIFILAPIEFALAADNPVLQQTSSTYQSFTPPRTKLDGELQNQFQKANNYGSVGDFDNAFKLYSSIIKYAPDFIYGYSNRANIQIAKGDLAAAISDYSIAITLSEKDPSLKVPDLWLIYLNRGTTHLALNHDDLALADFDKANTLRKQPEFLILVNRGQVYERRSDWVSAANDYRAAINLKPSEVQPWWLRYSLVLFQNDMDLEALPFARRVAVRYSTEPEALAALASIAYGHGDSIEATRVWNQIPAQERDKYLNSTYLQEQLRWPPKGVQSLLQFGQFIQNPKILPSG